MTDTIQVSQRAAALAGRICDGGMNDAQILSDIVAFERDLLAGQSGDYVLRADRETIAKDIYAFRVKNDPARIYVSWDELPDKETFLICADFMLSAAPSTDRDERDGVVATDRIRLGELFYHADGFLWQIPSGELVEPEPWIAEALKSEHCGDCTGVACSCLRCHAEEMVKLANWVADRWPSLASTGERDGEVERLPVGTEVEYLMPSEKHGDPDHKFAAKIIAHVEGWYELLFVFDDSTCIVRPSRVRAALNQGATDAE